MLGFWFGLVSGGLLSATGLWLLSGLTAWLPSRWAVALTVFFALLCASRDLKLLKFPLPQNARQVPRQVFDRAPWRAAVWFGFELGTGMRTYLTTAAPYVLAAALVLGVPNLLEALAIGLGFGIGRFAMAMLRYASGHGESWDELLWDRSRVVVPTASLASALVVSTLAVGLA